MSHVNVLKAFSGCVSPRNDYCTRLKQLHAPHCALAAQETTEWQINKRRSASTDVLYWELTMRRHRVLTSELAPLATDPHERVITPRRDWNKRLLLLAPLDILVLVSTSFIVRLMIIGNDKCPRNENISADPARPCAAVCECRTRWRRASGPLCSSCTLAWSHHTNYSTISNILNILETHQEC